MAEPAGRGTGAQGSRRDFLVSACATGITFAFAPALAGAATGVQDAAFSPTLWYRVDVDGMVTVHIIRAEIGQHVGTALARIVAEELEADWSKVRIEHVDTDPQWGDMATGGSLSVHDSFDLLSRAGAAGRLALLHAGARLLGVDAQQCIARNGEVLGAGRSIDYGQIVRRGRPTARYTAEQLQRLPLKAARERHLLGRQVPAIDVPAKVDGSTRYGIDARVDGMLYARPLLPPTRNGSRVIEVDDRAARTVPGYLRTLVLDDPSGTVPGWAVALGESFHAANQAAERVRIRWESDDTAGVSEADALAFAHQAVEQATGGAHFVADAGVDEGFATAARVLERRYTTASVLHFQLEPLNALALEKDGVWELHAGSQWPTHILPVLATALAVAPERIVVRSYPSGGGFGRRLNGDYLVPAALAAKAAGRPVKLVFTRADDSRFDSMRSPTVQRLRMALDHDRRVRAMQHDACAGWPNRIMDPGSLAKGANGELYDPDAINGADHWYGVGAHRVRALCNEVVNRAFRPGWLRSVSAGWTHWAVESFMDEAARAAGRDPVEFRLALLDGKGRNAGETPDNRHGAQRQAQVLRRVARKAGWGQPQPDGMGLGIATTFGQARATPTWVACVAQVAVDRATGSVKLHKLTLVVDAGIVIDPQGALAQVEGGALWGASMALHEGTQTHQGQVRDTNLDTYTPLRMGDVPELGIEFVDSIQPPAGLGEPAVTVVAPAIANAIHAATGARVRHLPIRPDAVLRALAHGA